MKRACQEAFSFFRVEAEESDDVVGEHTSVETLPIVAGQGPVEIAARAVQAAKLGGYV